MATLLSGTDAATGTVVNIPANDIITVLQKNGSTSCIVTYVSNKEIKTQVELTSKTISACAFQGGSIDGMVPVVLESNGTVITGTASAGAAATITLAGQSATNDVYNDMYIYITEGTGIGQVRKISDYVGATKVATVESNWTVEPDNTSVYIVTETGNLIQSQKVGVVDVELGVFMYNENNSAKSKLTLNADQDATAFVSYINTAIDEAAATYVTLSTNQTVSGTKDFTGDIKTDVISESTAAAGVTADSVLLKDGTVKTGAGAVGNVAVKVNADDMGVYEVSAVQLGVAVGGALVAGFDANGVFTGNIAEQVVGVGVTVDSVLLKDGGVSNGAETIFAGFFPKAAQQALSGAGAINVTSYYTAWTTTAPNAGTLADGSVIGQMKKIVLVADGGDGTLTPANLAGGTTITFENANDYVVLIWDGTDWNVIENVGCTIA